MKKGCITIKKDDCFGHESSITFMKGCLSVMTPSIGFGISPVQTKEIFDTMSFYYKHNNRACIVPNCNSIDCVSSVGDDDYICRGCIESFRKYIGNRIGFVTNYNTKDIKKYLEEFIKADKNDFTKQSIDDFFSVK